MVYVHKNLFEVVKTQNKIEVIEFKKKITIKKEPCTLGCR
jgi:hypothetical protein